MKKFRIWIAKFINNLLHDKDDFHKDDELKTMVELHTYLFDRLINVEKQLAPRKLRYFWRNKKKFLAKLFVKAFIAFSVVAGVLFCAWFFGFRYTPPPPTYIRQVTLYVPEGTDTNYIKSKLGKVKFILMHPPDPAKDWERYKEDIHFKFETKGQTDSVAYKTRNGEYWGKYQLGQGARNACGIGSMTWEEFSTNPELQEGIFKRWIRILYHDMSPYITKYEGKFMGGHQLTASGIISLAHNVGEGAAIGFLNGTNKNTSTAFLSLGGYDLTSILK